MMMLFQQILVLLISFAVTARGESSAKTISTSQRISDNLDEVEVNIRFPFKVGDFLLGFKHSLALVPKDNKIISGPDTLFAKRSLKTGDAGYVTVDTSLDTRSNIVSVAADWFHKKTGITMSLKGDSSKHLNEFGIKGSRKIQENEVQVALTYDVHHSSLDVDGSVWKGDNVLKCNYNTGSHTPKVALTHNMVGGSIKPSVNLKTGQIDIAWNQRWKGGFLESIIAIPDAKKSLSVEDKKLTLNWKDSGVHGAWLTKATIPLADFKKTKVTLSRDWDI